MGDALWAPLLSAVGGCVLCSLETIRSQPSEKDPNYPVKPGNAGYQGRRVAGRNWGLSFDLVVGLFSLTQPFSRFSLLVSGSMLGGTVLPETRANGSSRRWLP